MVTWAYVAGYFDGEGSIGIYGKRGWCLSFCNSHRESLVAIQSFIGAGTIQQRKGTNKPMYALRSRRIADIRRVISLMVEHCIIKREALLQFLKTTDGIPSARYGVLAEFGEDRVLELYAAGISTISIANLVGVNSEAVRAFLLRREVPLREKGEAMALAYRAGRWREGQTPIARLGADTIRRWYWEEGMSTVQVARRAGTTIRSVAAFMARYNIPRRSHAESMRQRASRSQ